MFNSIVTAIGIYAIVCWLYENLFASLLSIVWHTVRERTCGGKKRSLAERYGKWAVITGATDGIGKGYAWHLARHGINLVLISRTESKLKMVAKEIYDKFPVEIKWIAADFTDDCGIYPRIRKELQDLDIGILVNNVGMAADRLDPFESFSEGEHRTLLNVNILSTLWMSHMVLPWMKHARRGIIVNVSSMCARSPAPHGAMYSATKGFVYSLTEAIQLELRGTGVECQLVVPHFVRTNLIEDLDVSIFGKWFLPDGLQYGRWATFLIGKTGNTNGHWYHALLVLLQRLVPLSIQKVIIGIVFNHFRDQMKTKLKS
ncbi:very-long-chain 3-oxoacyl-CoA reductase-like [Ochlerotatus camptorhynchus]|uniref:very-long-chain 3-oxoacyl-CoA reductase-like n=1 Tax=Ochlerotatus camptorhynchus TaxID=644619 RepID=UPI0031E37DB9